MQELQLVKSENVQFMAKIINKYKLLAQPFVQQYMLIDCKHFGVTFSKKASCSHDPVYELF